MTPICASVPGAHETTTAAAIATLALERSGHRFLPMPQSACATTATATTFNPCNQAASAPPPTVVITSANSTSATAEGKVKPSQEASAPGNPLLSSPSAMPT